MGVARAKVIEVPATANGLVAALVVGASAVGMLTGTGAIGAVDTTAPGSAAAGSKAG